MGMFASARGWLEIDFKQRNTAEEIIRRHHHDLYSGGWAFPAAPFNWTLYLFYGGGIRNGELAWLREPIAELAAMPPIDDDGDCPAGLVPDHRRTRRGNDVASPGRVPGRTAGAVPGVAQ